VLWGNPTKNDGMIAIILLIIAMPDDSADVHGASGDLSLILLLALGFEHDRISLLLPVPSPASWQRQRRPAYLPADWPHVATKAGESGAQCVLKAIRVVPFFNKHLGHSEWTLTPGLVSERAPAVGRER